VEDEQNSLGWQMPFLRLRRRKGRAAAEHVQEKEAPLLGMHALALELAAFVDEGAGMAEEAELSGASVGPVLGESASDDGECQIRCVGHAGAAFSC
jgi:hypothetical protein